MTKIFIKKLSLVPELSCIEIKPKKEMEVKELLEEFINMLKNVGYSNKEISEALGTRKQIKSLYVEIGKLKSYIDELEYEIRTK